MNPSLLSQLLGLLNDGRVHTKEALVSALGTSSAMTDMMIEHLLRGGFLEEIGGDVSRDICSLCDRGRGSRAPCTSCPPGRAWLLTPKGMKLVAATRERADG